MYVVYWRCIIYYTGNNFSSRYYVLYLHFHQLQDFQVFFPSESLTKLCQISCNQSHSCIFLIKRLLNLQVVGKRCKNVFIKWRKFPNSYGATNDKVGVKSYSKKINENSGTTSHSLPTKHLMTPCDRIWTLVEKNVLLWVQKLNKIFS